MKNLLKDYNKSDKEIYEKEFFNFLPNKIIDSHIHLWKMDFFNKAISADRQKSNPFADPDIIEGFTFEEFGFVKETLFKDKEYEGIFFALPVKEIDLNLANKYVADTCKINNCYGLFVPSPDQKFIPDDFFENNFIGFKPYPDLTEYSQPDDFSKLDIDVSIFDFISKSVFNFADKHGLIILIHIPRKGRLNDQRNIIEIREIVKEYPNAKIILAHAGRSYCYTDIKDSIKYLKGFDNLYVDTAMINSYSVNKVLIEELGVEKVLYGSDLCVAALKGKNVDINNRHYFITSKPRTWSLSSNEMNLENFTYFIYEIIRAIKVASEDIKLQKKEIENIFYGNIAKIITSILKKQNLKKPTLSY